MNHQREAESNAFRTQKFFFVDPNYAREVIESEKYTQAFCDMWLEVSTGEHYLILGIYDDYLGRLEDALEEGMYDFVSDDPDLIKALYEVCEFARPVYFCEEDLIPMHIQEVKRVRKPMVAEVKTPRMGNGKPRGKHVNKNERE